MVDQIQGMSSMMGIGNRFNTVPLTADQQSQVDTILSQYDPKNLSAADAKKIMSAFKEAGIKPGSSLKETVQAAGFDFKDLMTKARPQGAHGHHRSQESSDASSTSSATQINLSSLKSLQEILNQFDLSNLSKTDATGLVKQLQQQGLAGTGSILDLNA